MTSKSECILLVSEVDSCYKTSEVASLEQGPGIHREHECSVVPLVSSMQCGRLWASVILPAAKTASLQYCNLHIYF